jgi:DNA-binding NarL/FixJ family response regulator
VEDGIPAAGCWQAHAAMPPAPRIRVLLAEDHRAMRAALERLLAGAGDLEVVAAAADGHEAVTLARRHRPDLVVLGLRMPGLDGIEATRRILRDHPGGRVLVLTGAPRGCDVRAALGAGATDCVAKDEGPEIVLARIRAAVSGRDGRAGCDGQGV